MFFHFSRTLYPLFKGKKKSSNHDEICLSKARGDIFLLFEIFSFWSQFPRAMAHTEEKGSSFFPLFFSPLLEPKVGVQILLLLSCPFGEPQQSFFVAGRPFPPPLFAPRKQIDFPFFFPLPDLDPKEKFRGGPFPLLFPGGFESTARNLRPGN